MKKAVVLKSFFLAVIICLSLDGCRLSASPLLVLEKKLQSDDIVENGDGQQFSPYVYDWDNDGKKDLIVGGSGGNIIWYKNQGGSPPSITLGGTILSDNNPNPTVCDWNNDGKKDLVVGVSSRYHKTFLNIGTDTSPAFDTGSYILAGSDSIATATGNGAFHPCVVDWNNDGKKDLVLGTYQGGGKVLVYRNVGTDASPVFANPPDTLANVVATNNYTPRVSVIDYDNDGKKDIILGNGDSPFSIRVYLNTGTDDTPAFSSSSALQGLGGNVGGYTFVSPFVVDWDADGKKDLIWGERLTGNVYFTKNIGTDASPQFYETIVLYTTSRDIYRANASVFPFDYNSDTDIDIVICRQNPNYFLLYKNTGTSSSPFLRNSGFVPGVSLAATNANINGKCSIVDWNSDGKYDFLVGSGDGGGQVGVHLNAGTNQEPSYSALAYLKVGGAGINVSVYTCPRSVDWNSDGKKDLLVGASDGLFYLFINTNTDDSPVFAVQTTLQDSTGATIDVGTRSTPWVIDWNEDGKKDLISGNSTGPIYLFLNCGTDASPVLSPSQTLNHAVGTPINYGTEATPTFIDWDYDGHLDMILSAGGYIYLLLNKVANSYVLPLSAAQTSLIFSVSWTGSAYYGVASYDVQIKEGENGAWQDLLANTTSTSLTYTGKNNTTYYFKSRVKDNQGNYEVYFDTPDAYTTVSVDYTKTVVQNLKAVTGASEGEVALSWTAPMNPVDITVTIKSYDIRYSRKDIQSVTDFENSAYIPVTVPTPKSYGETETLTVIGLSPGEVFYFALRSKDSLDSDLGLSNVTRARAYTNKIVNVKISPTDNSSVIVSNPVDPGTEIEIQPFSVDEEVWLSVFKRSSADLTSEQLKGIYAIPNVRTTTPLCIYDVIISDTQENEKTDFVFKRAVRLILKYEKPSPVDEEFISVYKWKDTWKKLGGTINKTNSTLTVYNSDFSRFAIFSAGLDKIGVLTSVFTPNDDGINDRIYFIFNKSEENVKITIYGMDGKPMRAWSDAKPEETYWDGKDMEGKLVESGVYIYTIKGSKSTTGTICVAK